MMIDKSEHLWKWFRLILL